jgi:hypothetical protein
MKERVRPHILLSEAVCPDGCGKMPTDGFLDAVDELIERYGYPIAINIMARCIKHNKLCGGVEDSPHLEDKKDHGGGDLKCWNPKKRFILIPIIVDMTKEGYFTQYEICNGHLHVAKVDKNHRLYHNCNWGQSR